MEASGWHARRDNQFHDIVVQLSGKERFVAFTVFDEMANQRLRSGKFARKFTRHKTRSLGYAAQVGAQLSLRGHWQNANPCSAPAS